MSVRVDSAPDVDSVPIDVRNWTGQMLTVGQRVIVDFLTGGGAAVVGAGQAAGWTDYPVDLIGTGWVLGQADVVEAIYLPNPDLVEVRVRILLSAATTIGTGQPFITLPVEADPAEDGYEPFMIRFTAVSGTTYWSPARISADANGDLSAAMLVGSISGTYLRHNAASGSAAPEAMANGDELWLSGSYRPV